MAKPKTGDRLSAPPKREIARAPEVDIDLENILLLAAVPIITKRSKRRKPKFNAKG
jgi:hypothetical protein